MTGPGGVGWTRRRLVLLGLGAVALAGCAPAERAPVGFPESATGTESVPPSPSSTSPAPTPATTTSGGTEATSAPPTRSPAAPKAAPQRLEIPAMRLDERVIDLGIADDGTLEVPEDPDRVGWFTGGGRPGGPGPTVFAGHVDSTTGPAVFARLTELRTGDEIAVTAADGVRRVYRVSRTEDVPKDRFPTEQVFGSTPDDQLRLITCTGVWDRQVRSHLENRIVHATAIR